MPPVFSHSRLSNFENCPKKFHFRYVLKTPVHTEGIEAFVGKRVHDILERLYRFVGRDMVPSIEKVVQRYYAFWDEHFDPQRIRIARAGTPVDFYRRLGEQGLRNYYHSNYPFDAGETLGLEQRVTFALDEAGRYRMQGFIDRISRARDGTLEIHDYKTGQRIPSQRQLDEDRQLALYQIGAAGRYGNGAPVRLVWHYVSKGQVRTSQRSPEQLEGLRKKTIELIDRINAATEFPTQKTPLCGWCEYKPLCPAWQTAGPPAARDLQLSAG